MRARKILPRLLLCFIAFSGWPTTANATEDTFSVVLPCTTEGWFGQTCKGETIEIPKGRPIYALLVSGFHQNRNFEMFHWYNFAKCLQEKGAYVHYAWWNNLLAPYMEKPLHNTGSVPSYEANPSHDLVGFIYEQWPFCTAIGGCYPNKALPAEDHQFQKDAKFLLERIRQENPDAAIILVGHSMGGDAVVRLADSMPADFDIDLFAPIDPVGNKTCIPNPLGPFCNGLFNFTRWRVTHADQFVLPPQRAFGANIRYLYHRWQQEFAPPFDYSCPQGPQSGSIPNPVCLSGHTESSYFLIHPAPLETSIHGDSTNVQAIFATSLYSGYDVFPRPDGYENSGGGLDGHGELVGFRGVVPADTLLNLFQPESYPMALKAQGNWPSRDKELDPNDPDDLERVRRVNLLKAWESDPDYFRENDYAPMAPDLCMVSDDMCTILNTKLTLAGNSSPVADAGADQTVECSHPNGAEVTLDGSGSSDPDGDPLFYSWSGPFGIWTGQTIYPELSLGTHSITLTVDDGNGNTDTDTVNVTVMDSTPPSLSVSLSPDSLWPANHKMMRVDASIQTSDSCDESPSVKLVSIISNENDNGTGDGNTSDDIRGANYGMDDRAFLLRAERAGKGLDRIYTVTYGATDASGNVAEDATTEVTVLHDGGK